MEKVESMFNSHLAIEVMLKRALKHGEFSSEELMKLAESEAGELTADFAAAIRRRLSGKAPETIVRRVKVDRNRSPLESLKMPRFGFTSEDDPHGDSVPPGDGDEVDVHLFAVDTSSYRGFMSDEDLAREYNLRGLKPDPYAVLAAYRAEPELTAKYVSCYSQWKDAEFGWRNLIVGWWFGSPMIRLGKSHPEVWSTGNYDLFAGVPK